MIGKHCGQPLAPRGDNKFYFRRLCLVCGRMFKQRKRLPKTSDRLKS